jgi:hypothetical protein
VVDLLGRVRDQAEPVQRLHHRRETDRRAGSVGGRQLADETDQRRKVDVGQAVVVLARHHQDRLAGSA